MRPKPIESLDLIDWHESCYSAFAAGCDWLDRWYDKYILQRTRDQNVLKFGPDEIDEASFVDCFKPDGRMRSDILHLVCSLWSEDWDDTIILKEASVDELLVGKELKSVKDDLTAEKVGLSKILIPLATASHFSLVAVSHRRKKKYLIDSLPGLHEEEARMVLDRLEAHLLAEHRIDISEYEVNSPEVLPQDNNRDCGFHVLLYIKGFEQMDIRGITGITTDKVNNFRKEISKYLYCHESNEKNIVNEVAVDPNEEEAVEIINPTANSAEGEIMEEHQNNASGRDHTPADSEDGTSSSEENNLNVDNNGDPPLNSHTARTRRTSGIILEHDSLLSAEQSDKIWQIIKEECKNTLIFEVGGIKLTGAKLKSCLHDAKSALEILNPFVECLKSDDKKKGLKKTRIVIPPQKLIGEEVKKEIVKEIGKANRRKKNVSQKCILCPLVHEEESIMLILDNNSDKIQISALHANDTKITEDQLQTFTTAFAEQVNKAYLEQGYALPVPDIDSLRLNVGLLNATHQNSAFASMVCIKEYDGYTMPSIMKNPNVAKVHKQTLLLHLLFHDNNEAGLPQDVELNKKPALEKGRGRCSLVG